jgi:PIN domain nuclease of toxin-antitoxin system
VPFSRVHAAFAASITPVTRALGLSLGDCACIALGMDLEVPVLTGDRAWSMVDVGVEVRLIR